MLGKFFKKVGGAIGKVSDKAVNLLGKIKSKKDEIKKYVEERPGLHSIYEAVANLPIPVVGGSLKSHLSKAESFIDQAHAKAAKMHDVINEMGTKGIPAHHAAAKIMSTPEKAPDIAPERQAALDNLKYE